MTSANPARHAHEAFAADRDQPVSPHLEEDGVDQLSADTFRAFIAAARLHARLIGRLLDTGEEIHPGQYFCLRAVGRHDGIAQRDLARELHVAAPSVSRMLQHMERAGLIERHDDEHDQRVTLVHVTERGRALEKKYRGVISGYVQDTIGRLPEADRRQLIRLLGAYSATLEAALDARTATPAAGAHAEQAGPDSPRRDIA